MRHEEILIIESEHPALVGHFPGNPVVPAVVILEKVFEALRKALPDPIRISMIPQAKFISPLRPEESLIIRLESEEPGEATFTCHVDSRLISSGSVHFTRREKEWDG